MKHKFGKSVIEEKVKKQRRTCTSRLTKSLCAVRVNAKQPIKAEGATVILSQQFNVVAEPAEWPGEETMMIIPVSDGAIGRETMRKHELFHHEELIMAITK